MQVYCHPVYKYLIFSISAYLVITKLLDLNLTNQQALTLTASIVFLYFLLENFTYSPIMVPIVADVNPNAGSGVTDTSSKSKYYDTDNLPPNVPPHIESVNPAFPTSKFIYK